MLIDDIMMRDRDQDGPDGLQAGYFLLPMRRSDRVDVPIRIWFGPPEDPDEPGAYLDRGHAWHIEINGIEAGDPDNPACIAGRPIEHLDEIWPRAKAFPITADDYAFRVARADHAEQWDENDAFGGTGRKIDPLTVTLPEFRQ